MEELKKFFESAVKIAQNLDRIATALESRVENITLDSKDCVAESNLTTGALTQSVAPSVSAGDAQIDTSTKDQLEIPVSQNVENFSQEQIARGMAAAMDCGKQGLVAEILNKFNASSLMDITGDNYGVIAIMLREAGISL